MLGFDFCVMSPSDRFGCHEKWMALSWLMSHHKMPAHSRLQQSLVWSHWFGFCGYHVLVEHLIYTMADMARSSTHNICSLYTQDCELRLQFCRWIKAHTNISPWICSLTKHSSPYIHRWWMGWTLYTEKGLQSLIDCQSDMRKTKLGRNHSRTPIWTV